MDDKEKLHCHFRQTRRISRIVAIALVTVLTASFSHAVAGETHGVLLPADVQVRSGNSDLLGDGGAAVEFFRKAFDTMEFQPRWQSENWTTAHAWLHIASDLVIAATYLLIAAVLTRTLRSRAGTPYARLFWLFAFFIFAGGVTHLLDALMFWWPAYRLTALAKAGDRADFSGDGRGSGPDCTPRRCAPQSRGDTTGNHPAAQNRTRVAASTRSA